MIKFKTTTQEQVIKTPISVICDKCLKEYDPEKDAMEVQEFLHINTTGGYGSIFGDESRIKCDICQNCVKKLIGDIIRVDGLTDKEWEKIKP
jgi:hypothetical protein